MSALLAALLSHSTFAPDEHYQSSEPTLCMLSYPCIRTWEWTNPDPIRTSLNLFPYALLYKSISLLPKLFFHPLLSTLLTALLSSLPLQYLITTLPSLAPVISSTWFLYYTGARSYSNSLETVLCTAVFVKLTTSKRPPYVLLGIICSLAITIRFSAGVYFLPLFLHHIYKTASLRFLLPFVPSLLLSFLLFHAIDCHFYERDFLSLPITYNNIMFNVISNSSELYGTHPWHWYITSCLPQITGVYAPFLIHSYTMLPARHSPCRLVTVFYVFIHSLNGHKELRFLLPVLPLMLIDISASASSFKLTRESPKIKALKYINVIAFLILSLVWQSGSILSMYQIGHKISSTERDLVKVDLLTSCHATPAHTHLFGGPAVEIRAIDCHVDCRRTDTCENDRYLADPNKFAREYELRGDFVVTENNWEAMEGRGYRKIGDWWDRVGEYKVVWQRNDWDSGEGSQINNKKDEF